MINIFMIIKKKEQKGMCTTNIGTAKKLVMHNRKSLNSCFQTDFLFDFFVCTYNRKCNFVS